MIKNQRQIVLEIFCFINHQSSEKKIKKLCLPWFSQTWKLAFLHFRSFFQLVGDIDELRDKVYDDVRPKGKSSRDFIPQASDEYQDIELSELQVIATLGVGGFGRVELVKVREFE